MDYVVAKEFSPITGLRHCNVMVYSGEEFYHTKLNKVFAECYQKKEVLRLILDGSLDGYSPSFIDEAIGNLVYDFTLAVVREYLEVVSDMDRRWIKLIEKTTYPLWEERRINQQPPKVTDPHKAWYRLVDGQLLEKVWLDPD